MERKQKNIKTHQKAFTLIELLVVVLIIGILSAIALPQYKKAVLKTRATEAIINLKNLKQAQERYYLANGEYTTDLSKLDIEVKNGFYYYTCPNGINDCYAFAQDGSRPFFEAISNPDTLFCRGTDTECKPFSTKNAYADPESNYWAIEF